MSYSRGVEQSSLVKRPPASSQQPTVLYTASSDSCPASPPRQGASKRSTVPALGNPLLDQYQSHPQHRLRTHPSQCRPLQGMTPPPKNILLPPRVPTSAKSDSPFAFSACVSRMFCSSWVELASSTNLSSLQASDGPDCAAQQLAGRDRDAVGSDAYKAHTQVAAG